MTTANNQNVTITKTNAIYRIAARDLVLVCTTPNVWEMYRVIQRGKSAGLEMYVRNLDNQEAYSAYAALSHGAESWSCENLFKTLRAA